MKVAECSFAEFVYPFLFEAGEFESLVRAAGEARWPGREGKSFTIWQVAQFPEEDLLAHVRDYLNPPEGKVPTARIWAMDNNTLQSPSGLGAQAEWELVRKAMALPFKIKGVQLALFRVGVGFVAVEANPQSEAVEDWLDFLHYFRFVRGQRDVYVRAKRREAKDHFGPFFPEPAGGLEKHRDGQATFSEVVEAILQTAMPPDGLFRRRWQEVFVPGQLIPFATLYLDDDEISDGKVAEFLYRVRNFFPSKRVIAPSPEQLPASHPLLLPYAQRMWFLFGQEGSAFIAINAPQTDFFRRELPDHLRRHYFLLFVLTLHQKFALMSLSQQVSEHWFVGDELTRAKAFDRIRRRLMEFTARGYFTQVMQQEHHHRVYRKWQEIFQLEQLYREVSDEVREMHEYLLSEQTKRLERRLNLLGAFIGVPALVIGFLSINLYGLTAREEGLPLWLALLISFGAGGLLGGVVLWLLQGRRS
jgi:hypothetical protein